MADLVTFELDGKAISRQEFFDLFEAANCWPPRPQGTTFQVNGAEVSKDEFQEIITTPWEELPEELKERPLPPLEEECQEEETSSVQVVSKDQSSTSAPQGSSATTATITMNFEERFTQRGWNMWMREQQLEREYHLALQRYKGYKHFRQRVLGAIENEPDWKVKYNSGQLRKFSPAICPPLESKKAPKICKECHQNPREDGKMGELPCGVAVTRPISTWATNHVEKVKKEHYFFDTKPVTKDSMEVSYQVVDIQPSTQWEKVVELEFSEEGVRQETHWLSTKQRNDMLVALKAIRLMQRLHELETLEELPAIREEGRNLLDLLEDEEDKQRLLQEWETIMTQLASSRSPTQEPREEAQEKACSD